VRDACRNSTTKLGGILGLRYTRRLRLDESSPPPSNQTDVRTVLSRPLLKPVQWCSAGAAIPKKRASTADLPP
jgi:hypothetical protein